MENLQVALTPARNVLHEVVSLIIKYGYIRAI